MKKSIGIALVVVVLILATLACRISLPSVEIGISGVTGSGNITKEERSVSDITSVRVANQGDLVITLGDKETLVIEAEDNLLEYIESNVRGDELVLETRDGINIRNTEPILYYLTVTDLDRVSVSSSGDIVVPEISSDRFSINVSSSGDIVLDGLFVDSLQVDISSSGDVFIGELSAERLEVNISSSGKLGIADGYIEMQDISISSSGDYDGRDVESVQADVSISSSGNVTIRVSEELDASISSSGDLYYYGNPTTNIRQSSSGEVIRLGD